MGKYQKVPQVPVGEPGETVVNFQLVRCRAHAQELQMAIQEMAEELAYAAGCPLTTLSNLDGYSDSYLEEESYAIFDFVGFKTSRSKRMLRADWAPFVLFVNGQQSMSLLATYDTKGARISGVSLNIEGDQLIKSRCRSLSVAKKILLSHIQTYVRADE